MIGRAIDGGLIQEVVEPYFWYNQRASSTTRTRIIRREIPRKSGRYLRGVFEIKAPIGLNHRVATTAIRQCVLSLAHCLGKRSTFRTLTKTGIPMREIPTITIICPKWLVAATFHFIPKICGLCTEVGRAWQYSSCSCGGQIYSYCYRAGLTDRPVYVAVLRLAIRYNVWES